MEQQNTTDYPLGNLIPQVQEAKIRLTGIAGHTPLIEMPTLNEKFNANISLKREDLQMVRSYKIRGAYNKIASLDEADRKIGVICASAGNHAQGVAYACYLLNIKGIIVMPETTPKQKIKQTKYFGKEAIEVILHGDNFDEASAKAAEIRQEQGLVFIHPFDDPLVIAGQGTVALELLEDAKTHIDYVFLPIGGGGLAAGICSVFRHLSPKTKLIGVEPEGAPSMKTSIQENKNITLDQIDKFVDGAAVKRVGDRNFEICKDVLSDIVVVPEGKVCTTILDLYNQNAIVVEPAGALSVAALDFYREQIAGKNVVCIISGSNNDITRLEEIKERSMLYEGLKHYFIINFPQRAGALKDLLNNALGPDDDISYFQYIKKNNKETGPAIVGIELKSKKDFQPFLDRLKALNFDFKYLNGDKTLFALMIG
jgi:threonine dehydratase